MAHYLLSRFSFVAQPTTIADDTGSDFYCTIFDILNTEPPAVEARTSFAIQIKSNARTITAHNKVQALFHLEIPYFIGIVKLATAELKIYSAEWFPMMTATFGVPEKLWLRLVEKSHLSKLWEGIDAKTGVTLNCYHVCTFNASESRDDIRPKVTQLLKLCRRAVNNISARRIEAHTYQLDDGFYVVAGSGSVDYFRDNMYKRLAETFNNFDYMITRDPALFNLAEFRLYEAFYSDLVKSYPRDSLQLACAAYLRAKTSVDRMLAGRANT